MQMMVVVVKSQGPADKMRLLKGKDEAEDGERRRGDNTARRLMEWIGSHDVMMHKQPRADEAYYSYLAEEISR